MTVQFIVAAVALCVLAVAIIAWPRRAETSASRRQQNVDLYRSQLQELEREQKDGRLSGEVFAALKAELGAALLGDVGQARTGGPTRGDGFSLVLWVAALVPVLAGVGYWQAGALPDLEMAAAMRNADEAVGKGDHNTQQLLALANGLESKLANRPDDADGWFMLGRTSLSMQDFPRAARAFRRVTELMPQAPAPRVYMVQAKYLSGSRVMTDEIRADIDAVFAIQPDEPIMLELLALDAMQHGQMREALGFLERGLKQDLAGEQGKFFQAGAEHLRAQLGMAVATGEAQNGVAAAQVGPAVVVSVALAPGVEAPADAVVFVTARFAEGPPMPLAAVRKRVADLPARVRLDDSVAMSPATSLSSSAGRDVIVSARVSIGGTAARSDGDVEVTSRPFAARGVQELNLVIGGSDMASPTMAAANAVATATPRTDGASSSDGARSEAALSGDGVAATTPGTPARASGESSAAGRKVQVLVEVDPAQALPPRDATVFVIARQRGGPPMPLAVRRMAVGDLPALIALSDADAMAPGRNLSNTAEIEVLARVSLSGTATPSPGDLESVAVAAPVDAEGAVLKVLIDRRR